MALMHHAGVITGVSSTYVGLLWLNEVICRAIHRSSVIQEQTSLRAALVLEGSYAYCPPLI